MVRQMNESEGLSLKDLLMTDATISKVNLISEIVTLVNKFHNECGSSLGTLNMTSIYMSNDG